MGEGKKRSKSQVLGDKAVSILKNMFPSEWVTREFNPDYGIDLAIEIFEPFDTGYLATGEHIYFQVKGTENLEIKKFKVFERMNVEKEITIKEKYEDIDVVKFQLDTAILRTIEKMGSAVPVLLIVVDIVNLSAYYVCLNDYIEKVIVPENPNYDKQKTIMVNIPTENVIHDKKDILPIEWYSKRAKLFALFNKAHYQRSELEYIGDECLTDYIVHFAEIIRRLDAWKASKYFLALHMAKSDLDYFLEHKITRNAEQQIKEHMKKGEDVDSLCWETNHSIDEISFKSASIAMDLRTLWDNICNCGNIFEDIAKEWYLPTYLGIIARL